MTLERNVAIPRCREGEAADVHGKVQVGDVGRVRRRPGGSRGALLRREGLYSSHIVEWCKARDAGALAGLAVPRGRKRRDPQAEKIARLEAEKRQLEQELAKARFVVDVQAKLSAYAGDRCQVRGPSSLVSSSR